jgi:Derlin-2/3
MEFINSIPPFTRAWGVAIIAIGILVTLNVVSPYVLVFDPQRVLHGEVWRIVTSLFFVGRLDLNLFLHVVMSLYFVVPFEQKFYAQRLSAITFIFILTAVLVLALSGGMGSFSTASSMLMAFTYLCAKHLGDMEVRVFFLLPVPMRWLPFVNIGIAYLQAQSILPSVIGIIAGHTVFFLLYILPVALGRPILQTPPILVRLLDAQGGQQGARNQAQPVFRGGGRRLGG